MVLSNGELSNIYGGAIKYGWIAAVGGLITLIVGIIDGQIKLK